MGSKRRTKNSILISPERLNSALLSVRSFHSWADINRIKGNTKSIPKLYFKINLQIVAVLLVLS